MKLLFIFSTLISLNLCSGKLFVNPYPKFQTHSGKSDEFTDSDILYITPHLKAGEDVTKIQKMALVTLDELKEFPGYSGFITVNETFNSNMFFWFFPAQVDPANAPVVLWLQGKLFI